MTTTNPQSVARPSDEALRQRIHDEIRTLLEQRGELARLEQAAALREDASRVAHDIRNPLATIQSICTTLILETDDPEQQERLELISSQVDRLASALTQIVGRTRDADDTPRLINLEELSQSLINLLRYQAADDFAFDLRIESGLQCMLPERALTRSLYHLLRNAVEASREHPGGRVCLHCRRDGRLLEVRVTDNGPGLPRELIDKGLRPYAAARPDKALGLSSVDRFVRDLGGDLELGHTGTNGARVVFRVPADWLAPAAPSH
jgi:signal transduction histidine kinase